MLSESGKTAQLEKTETWIGYLLRAGVLISAFIISAGMVLGFLHQPGSDAAVNAGIVILIMLPVARVALTLILFVVQKDRLYMFITAFVLAVLLFGLAYGRAY